MNVRAKAMRECEKNSEGKMSAVIGMDQEKIAEIRSKAAEEFPMTMESSHAGSVMAEA